MSPDSTRATVAFAGKIGLETQWSFVISLRESGAAALNTKTSGHVAAAGTDDVAGGTTPLPPPLSASSSPLPNTAGAAAPAAVASVDHVNSIQARPPVGMAEVREYIRVTMDDMPLRVSVHTNCTSS